MYVIYGDALGTAPSFSLPALELDQCGDGSAGFVIAGIVPDNLDHDWNAACVPDLNGDGISDIAIGSPSFADSVCGSGQASLLFGRNGTFPPAVALADLLPPAGGDGSAGFVLNGAAFPNARTGNAVVGLGGINGDGYGDLPRQRRGGAGRQPPRRQGPMLCARAALRVAASAGSARTAPTASSPSINSTNKNLMARPGLVEIAGAMR